MMGYFEESLAIHSPLDRVETSLDRTSIESKQNILDGWASAAEGIRKGFTGKDRCSGNNRMSEIISGSNGRSSMKTKQLRVLLQSIPGMPQVLLWLHHTFQAFSLLLFSLISKYSQGCTLVISDPEFWDYDLKVIRASEWWTWMLVWIDSCWTCFVLHMLWIMSLFSVHTPIFLSLHSTHHWQIHPPQTLLWSCPSLCSKKILKWPSVICKGSNALAWSSGPTTIWPYCELFLPLSPVL